MKPASLGIHVRRVRRGDLRDITALVEASSLPPMASDRAGLKRFRNIVADLGCDFDVAIERDRVRGFAHLAYTRDLLAGNRGQLLALVAASAEVREALLASAIERATRRHCRDITVVAGPWIDFAPAAPDEWRKADGWRIELSDAAAGGTTSARDLPGATQTCRG